MRRNSLMQRQFRYQGLWQKAIHKITIHVRIVRIIQEYLNPNTEEFTEMIQNRSSKVRATDFNSNLPRGVISNESIYKEIWDLFMAIVLIYIAIANPYIISFLDTAQQDSFYYIDVIIDTLFIFDLILTLNTAFYNEDNILISSRSGIFKNYFKHGLILDIFSSVPLTYFGSSTSSYSNLVKFLRLRSITRFFKLSKLFKVFSKESSIFKNFQSFIGLSYTSERVIRVIVQVSICLHIGACIWNLLAKVEDYGPGTWVFKFNLQDMPTSKIYLKSLYYLLVTLSTIGYGDISAVSINEKIFAIFWMILALYFLSYSISSLTSLLNQIDVKRTLLGEYMNLIDDFSREVKLSKRLKKEIQNTILLKIEVLASCYKDKTLFINDFPKELKQQIAVSLQGGLAVRFKLFTDADIHVISEVLPFLGSFTVKAMQKVYCVGENAKKIYFLVKGSVNFLLKNEKTAFLVFSDLKYFGDVETLLMLPRMNSAETSTECQFLIMGIKLVKKIQKYFPLFYMQMKEAAFNRLKSTQKARLEMKTIIKMKSIETFKRASLMSIRDVIKKRTATMNIMKKEPAVRSHQRYVVDKYLNQTQSKLEDCKVELDNFKSLLNKLKCIYK